MSTTTRRAPLWMKPAPLAPSSTATMTQTEIEAARPEERERADRLQHVEGERARVIQEVVTGEEVDPELHEASQARPEAGAPCCGRSRFRHSSAAYPAPPGPKTR